MKYIRNFVDSSSAIVATDLLSPNVTLVQDENKILNIDCGLDVSVLIKRDSSGNLVIEEMPSSPTYSYVDLGLASGTLWMTCNLGASSPEEYGDYYAWGETEPYYDSISWSGTTPTVTWKSGKSAGYAEDWSNYKYYSGGEFTKYNETDGKSVLENSDDAIYIATSGVYKLPTLAQVQELVALSSELTTQSGVYGRLFTGNNGNTLFIPGSGGFVGDTAYGVGMEGDVWSSALRTDVVATAWVLSFDSEDAREHDDSRGYGSALRGVKA